MVACRMAAKFSQHVALTAPLARYVADQIARGEYATASEVIRAGLRLLIERDEDRALARAGRDSRPVGATKPARGQA
ncbi:putative addiction module antidote protein, CC2985 family [Methylobacterium phyllostachyos]|uniref:Putative addiction module antidote protein, CC2985 family n=2 Tax=Methylobacterium phyllostachyos TaxID=582672 RepID=A0A1G9WY36_9HYPH|nr:putative addiction module antidote protein, CC2985 family [Methylobacterium phyllostachyos]